jgi:hypothetical protein
MKLRYISSGGVVSAGRGSEGSQPFDGRIHIFLYPPFSFIGKIRNQFQVELGEDGRGHLFDATVRVTHQVVQSPAQVDRRDR